MTCAFVVLLSALVIWPVVELGVNDEWSYVKTVQVLAQTGHIVYNGWSAAILGWQLYLGALFVKLFGFSFTTIRLSMLVVSIATAFLSHRVMVLCGINDWNATAGTLALVLSPLFLPLGMTFMTDVPGFFCIVLCFYACLRALQAETDNAAIAWICFAAVTNAIGGTVRQIAWLGVLVMVPSTLWLLRRRPRLIAVGAFIYVACIAFIYGALRWFHLQPNSVREGLIQGTLTPRTPFHAIWTLLFSVPELALLLLPLLLCFVPAVPLRNRRAVQLLAAGGLAWVAFASVVAYRQQQDWILPYFSSYISVYGIMQVDLPHGTTPVVLNYGSRLVLTCLTALAMICFVAVVAVRERTGPTTPASVLNSRSCISWRDLGVLLVPVTLSYFVLLLPRAAFQTIYDRYFLPLMLLAMIPVLRCYQERVQPRLPVAVALPIALYAAFAVAGTHDYFSRARASQAAIRELRSRGIPPLAIDGGWEYNGWNQIEQANFIHETRTPALPLDHSKNSFGACRPQSFAWFPVLRPRFGLATSEADCLGSAGFAPVQYHTWLGPHDRAIYIVKVGRPGPAQLASGQ